MYLGIGGGYSFSRMRNHIGHFIGLSGYALKGKEVVECGIADFFVRRQNLKDLEQEIFQNTAAKTTLEDLRIIIKKYAEPASSKYEHEELIDRTFNRNSVQEIFDELEKARSDSEFAGKILSTMKSYSPTSLQVVFEQLKRGKDMSLAENYKMDTRIGKRF